MRLLRQLVATATVAAAVMRQRFRPVLKLVEIVKQLPCSLANGP